MKIKGFFKELLFILWVILCGGVFYQLMIPYQKRWDVTEQKIYTLPEETLKVLGRLVDPVKCSIYLPRTSETQELFNHVEKILDQFQSRVADFAIEKLEPFGKESLKSQLARDKFGIAPQSSGEIIFEYQDQFKKVLVGELADFERDSNGKVFSLRSFKGVALFTNALQSLLSRPKGAIYFIQGHGERSLSDTTGDGFSQLKGELSFQNVTLKDLPLGQIDEIPEEARLIVLARPTLPLSPYEILLLDGYLKKNGRVLALLDPILNERGDGLKPLGLEPWLKEWGISVGNNILVDFSNHFSPQDPTLFQVRNYNPIPLLQRFHGGGIPFTTGFARSISLSTPKDLSYIPKSLFFTSPEGWGETEISGFQSGVLKKGVEDLPGPVSLGVNLSADQDSDLKKKSTGEKGARLMVIGDSDFLANNLISQPGNKDLGITLIRYLLDEADWIRLPETDFKSLKLKIPLDQLTSFRLFNLIGFPFLVLAFGAVIYYLRNRG